MFGLFLTCCAQLPTKVFSLQNSSVYKYPKEKLCLLVELGAASSLVSLSLCDLLLYFDSERDMHMFLQQRRNALSNNATVTLPHGMFMTWIVFVNHGGRNLGDGRYILQIDKSRVMILKQEKKKNGFRIVLDLKINDCQIEIQHEYLKLFNIMEELHIYSADELIDIQKCVSSCVV